MDHLRTSHVGHGMAGQTRHGWPDTAEQLHACKLAGRVGWLMRAMGVCWHVFAQRMGIGAVTLDVCCSDGC